VAVTTAGAVCIVRGTVLSELVEERRDEHRPLERIERSDGIHSATPVKDARRTDEEQGSPIVLACACCDGEAELGIHEAHAGWYDGCKLLKRRRSGEDKRGACTVR